MSLRSDPPFDNDQITVAQHEWDCPGSPDSHLSWAALAADCLGHLGPSETMQEHDSRRSPRDPAKPYRPKPLSFHGALSVRGCESANLRLCQEAMPWTRSEFILASM